jgi:hypothetical protein
MLKGRVAALPGSGTGTPGAVQNDGVLAGSGIRI